MILARLRFLTVGLLLPFIAACSQADAFDPVKADSKIYKEVLETPQFRLITATLQPGQMQRNPHVHPKHIIYVLEGGEIMHYNEAGEAQLIKLKTGKTMAKETENAHIMENVSNHEVSYLIIEIKGEP